MVCVVVPERGGTKEDQRQRDLARSCQALLTELQYSRRISATSSKAMFFEGQTYLEKVTGSAKTILFWVKISKSIQKSTITNPKAS